MKIAVLGAGLTGLTAAYYLSQKGYKVTVFEKEATSGGLASCFKNNDWEWPLERFYHHLFANDFAAVNLIKKLGLGPKLFFKKPITAIYYQNSNHPFDSASALLKFPHLTFSERLRTGAVLAYLKLISNYKSLEKITAEKWLKKTMGQRSFDVLWKPLLTSKFGNYASKVSAAWFWARIKKRTKSLGYLEGSFQILIDCLIEKIKENNGQILLNNEVVKIRQDNKGTLHVHFNDMNHYSEFDKVVVTIPTSIFLKITSGLLKNYRLPLSQISHLWAQTLILKLKEPFLKKIYWLNINDASFPFLAVVEHTNFIDKSHYGDHHLLYIGNYLPNGHPYLKKSAAELFEIFKPYLQKINPNYTLDAKRYMLFSAPFAQPIIPVNYSKIIPPFETPIKNVYLANMQQVYPWDRGTNYAIELGEKVAELIKNES